MITLLQLAENEFVLWATVDKYQMSPIMSREEMFAEFDEIQYGFQKRIELAISRGEEYAKTVLAKAGLSIQQMLSEGERLPKTKYKRCRWMPKFNGITVYFKSNKRGQE